MSERFRRQLVATVTVVLIYVIWLAFEVQSVLGFIYWLLELGIHGLFLLFVVNHWDRKYQVYGGSYSMRAMVDVFVPTKNEPRQIVQKTVMAAKALLHPNTRVYLIDDGERGWCRRMAQDLGCSYLVRPDRLEKPYKAAAMNYAMAHSYGVYILVLDADQVVKSQMLDDLLGHFKDEKVALVGTKQAFAVGRDDFNHDHMFYDYMQTGKNADDSAISVGSGVIYRRRALEEIGGFQEWNVVEDLSTSYMLNRKGYKTRYIPQAYTLGLAPKSVKTIYKQRGTWALDTLRLLFHKRLIFDAEMSWRQRLHYAEVGVIYLASGWLIPGLMMVNVMALFINDSLVDNALGFVVLKTVSFGALMMLYTRMSRGTESSQMWASLFPVYLMASLKALGKSKPVYRVTSKVNEPKNSVGDVWPHLVLLSTMGLAALYHMQRYGLTGLLVINTLWLGIFVYWFWPLLSRSLFVRNGRFDE